MLGPKTMEKDGQQLLTSTYIAKNVDFLTWARGMKCNYWSNGFFRGDLSLFSLNDFSLSKRIPP